MQREESILEETDYWQSSSKSIPVSLNKTSRSSGTRATSANYKNVINS